MEEFVGEGGRFGLGQPRENEKYEERKGGVPRRDEEMCTMFGMKRTRNYGFVAGDDSLEQIGENEGDRGCSPGL